VDTGADAGQEVWLDAADLGAYRTVPRFEVEPICDGAPSLAELSMHGHADD
jgi:hypothetical protein